MPSGKCLIQMQHACMIGTVWIIGTSGLCSELLLRREATQVPEVRSPTVRRRELGALLRALRNEKGLTVEQVADRLLCSPSKVSRMETGHGIATPRDIRDLCDLYDVADQAERDRMTQLSHDSKQQGWWQSYDLPYSTYVGLEAEAV